MGQQRYSSTDIAQAAGASYAQLDRWARRQHWTPGTGRERRWTLDDAVLLAAEVEVASALDQGWRRRLAAADPTQDVFVLGNGHAALVVNLAAIRHSLRQRLVDGNSV